MTSTVTHFEIFAEEPATLAEFYRKLLGWDVEMVPGVNYWRIQTTPEDSKGINGPRSSVNYVHVESLDRTIEQLTSLGGAVVRPKAAVPMTAWYAVVSDPQGNVFGLWQSDPLAMSPSEPEH